jgi:uncharacterized protein YndB with AHSA1/START domain
MSTDRIEKKILLHAPLKRVWRALSDSTEFGTWFGVRFDGPFVAGEKVRGVIAPTEVNAEVAKAQKEHEGTPFEIAIEQMEPDRLFSFRSQWQGDATLVVFTLEEAANGVMLTVTESGFDRIPIERRAKMFAANEQGWTMMVKVLGEYLAGTQ